jgi:CrcB protein
MIREIITVGLGGAAGSIVRYLVSYGLLAGHTLLGFPAGTFTVNAAGSLVIGFLLALAPSASASQLLVVGFCGGFTTFSTFSADAVRLLRAGDYGGRLRGPERGGMHRLRRAGHVDRRTTEKLKTQKIEHYGNFGIELRLVLDQVSGHRHGGRIEQTAR